MRKHRESLGGPRLRVSAMLKGRIPAGLVEYLAGFDTAPSAPSVVAAVGNTSRLSIAKCPMSEGASERDRLTQTREWGSRECLAPMW